MQVSAPSAAAAAAAASAAAATVVAAATTAAEGNNYLNKVFSSLHALEDEDIDVAMRCLYT